MGAGNPARWLRAGIVGRPHGLDGSFYVTEPKPDLLVLGLDIWIAGATRLITRRAGFDRGVILALEGCEDRSAAQALGGEELLVGRDRAPELGAEEWWAEDLEGCAVRDGQRQIGVVKRLLALPSCEVLEVTRLGGGRELLVPLIKDAVREVDVSRREIEIDLRFLGEE
jgi:16S rRNA processing protein RimM